MKPLSFHEFHPLPGRVIEWEVSPATAEAASTAAAGPSPVSYNQQLHLANAGSAALAGEPGNPWIGVTFDIEGPGDLDALGAAFTLWMQRHDALRSGFRAAEEGLERFTVPADQVSLVHGAARDFRGPDELHGYLDQRFVAGTHPLDWPPLVLGIVSRPDTSTVFVAVDHVAADGFSLALAVWELHTSYEAYRAGGLPELPEVGSSLEHSVLERERGATIGADDPALSRWRAFVEACGGTTPTFPLDLGVEVGQLRAQTMFSVRLLSEPEAAAVEDVCRRMGGGLFAGLLAAMGIAVRELTGAQEFRTIMPLHTRHEDRWRSAMGWFITCAPVEFPVEAGSFADTLIGAHAAVRSALRLSDYPAVRMVELLGDDFKVTRRDLFSMVSYTDYRKMPGADRYGEWNPRTIGQVAQADDTHVWVSRLPNGVHMTIRHPDTSVAEEVLSEYVACITEVLRQVQRSEDVVVGKARPVSP